MKLRSLSLALALFASIFGAAAQAAPQPPDVAVRATTEKLRGLIQQNHAQYKADNAKFYKVVDQVVVPRFDVPYIGQLILGREWKTANPQQRKRFQAAFKHSLVHSYATALLDYHDSVKEQWQPLQMAAGAKEATVQLTLLRDNAQPIALGFATRLAGAEWKVYDVNVEGVSLVSNFRAQFGAEIKKNGLDALIARLESGAKPLPPKTAS